MLPQIENSRNINFAFDKEQLKDDEYKKIALNLGLHHL